MGQQSQFDIVLRAPQSRQLLGFLGGHSLGSLVELGLGLETHVTTTPLADQFGVVVVLLLGQVLEEVQLSIIGGIDTGEGDAGSRLHVDEGTEAGLVLDNHKGDTHLAAEGRHPHDELDGIDIVGNEDELSLLLLNESGNVLEAKLDLVGDLLGGVLLASSLGGGNLLNALLLGGRSLRSVLVEERKDSHGLVLAEHLGELVDGRRHLEALVEHSSLALDADVSGPSDEATEIATGGADVTADGEVAGAGGKEGIGGLGGGSLGLFFLAGFGLLGGLEESVSCL